MKIYSDENHEYFIHVSCVLSCPDVLFDNPKRRKGVKDVKVVRKLKKHGTNYKCVYNEDDEKSLGALVGLEGHKF